MKVLIFRFIILFVLFESLNLAKAESFWQSEFMPIDVAEKKWGITPLNIARFRAGALDKRASMAVDILKRALYVGQSRKKVREELGDPDSYFFSDTIYAYKIMPFPGAEKEV